jgi:HEAT repeat protein
VSALTYFCWRCYGRNPRPAGECTECGGELAAPAGTGYDERLVWALGHPVRERATVAARILGRRRTRAARGPLRELALAPDDPYLAAVALESLVAIDGVDELRDLLERLARDGSAPVRAVAVGALAAGRVQEPQP